MPSATPRAHAASTLPLSSMILVLSLREGSHESPLAGWPSASSSRRVKYSLARWTKLVPMFFPIRSLPWT